MSDVTLNRMSPYNINDDLIRAKFYKEIRDIKNDSEAEWLEYEVSPGEAFLPEVIAYRVYGSEEMKWVVLVAGGLDDMREAMEYGTPIILPAKTWLRERIKYYSETEALEPYKRIEPRSYRLFIDWSGGGGGDMLFELDGEDNIMPVEG